MISFLNPEDLAPLADMRTTEQQIAKLHAEFTDQKFYEALFAKFGEIPTHEDIAAHCQCFIDADYVHHYVWFEGGKPDWTTGERVDLGQAFLSIAPPKIFTPNPEN